MFESSRVHRRYHLSSCDSQAACWRMREASGRDELAGCAERRGARPEENDGKGARQIQIPDHSRPLMQQQCSYLLVVGNGREQKKKNASRVRLKCVVKNFEVLDRVQDQSEQVANAPNP